MTGNLARSIYSLPLGWPHSDRWKIENPITAAMRPLYDAIAAAVDTGIYYTRDMTAYIRARFNFTGPGLDTHKGTEGGAIGMEIYYARRRLDADRDAIEQSAAFKRLSLRHGENVGALHFHNGKKGRFRNAIIEAATPERITAIATAGGRKFTITLTPVKLERAMREALDTAPGA